MDLIFCKFVIVAQSINNQSTSNSIIQIFVSETTEKKRRFYFSYNANYTKL